MVLMRHYIHHPSLLLLGPQWGWMGVNLFFVLSGFLITSILLRLTDQRGALKIFYVRRSLRLFPLYFLALLVYFVASASVGTPQPLKTVLLYISFLQAFIAAPDHASDHRAASGLGGDGIWCAVVAVGGRVFLYSLGSAGHVHARATALLYYTVLALILLLTPWIRYFYPGPERGPGIVPRADGFAGRRMPGGHPLVGLRPRAGEPACNAMRAGCMDALRR